MSIVDPKPDVIDRDGKLWEASYPEDNPFEPCWFFRRVVPTNRPWWAFWRPRWRRTGETWKTQSDIGWSVVKQRGLAP